MDSQVTFANPDMCRLQHYAKKKGVLYKNIKCGVELRNLRNKSLVNRCSLPAVLFGTKCEAEFNLTMFDLILKLIFLRHLFK